jgi:hypothetical protein
MNDLPEFEKRPHHRVMPFATSLFGQNLVDLTTFEDGHYRVVFKGGVFTFAEGQTEPSSSQWSTLKKRLKRHDRSIFVFKEHGGLTCPPPNDSQQCYYVDFGFFKYT